LREIDQLAMKASQDEEIFEQLTHRYESHIRAVASSVRHNFVTKSDDEWSIALEAFHTAVQTYDMEKGSFLSYADLVMKRKLIDYSRKQGKYDQEEIVDPYLFESDSRSQDENDGALQSEVSRQVAITSLSMEEDRQSIALEINAISGILSGYGFSFMELTEVSPHAEKTRKACAKAVNYILQSPVLAKEMRRSKQLPIKIIEKNEKLPRKILERHRKYIIAAVEILSGEYPNLAEYLHFIRKEADI